MKKLIAIIFSISLAIMGTACSSINRDGDTDRGSHTHENDKQYSIRGGGRHNDKTALAPPARLRVTAKTDRTISLAWQSANAKDHVEEYEIYNGRVRIGTSTKTHVTLKELIPRTTYQLTVKARDQSWNFSPASNSIRVSTDVSRDTTPPSTPLNVTVTSAKDTSIRLEWDPSKDNYDIVEFRGTYDIYNGTTLLANSAGPKVTLEKLKPSTTYTLSVRAKDEAGNLSSASNSVSVSTGPLDTSPPTAPTNLRVQKKTDSTVTLTWNEASDNYGVTSYEVYRDDIKIIETTSPNFVIGELHPRTKYSFNVIAKDAKGNVSSASNRVTEYTGSTKPAPPSHMITGYYASWATYGNYEVFDIDASKLTHINYGFADIGDDLKIKVGDPWADVEKIFSGDTSTDPFKGNFNQLKKLKQKHPHLKTIISVGGWTWSQKFSDMALTDASRTAFADSVVDFLVTYGFDGIDFDWEFPVKGGYKTNVNRPVDEKNYTLLLQKVRQKLDAQQALDGKKYSISIAAGATRDFANNTQLGQISKFVDHILLMTYDIRGPWDNMTGFNAPLYAGSNEPFDKRWSVSQAVELFLNKGVPTSKLVLGVPFYGYQFKAVNRANKGLYQPYTGVTASINYVDLEKNFINKNGFVRNWHSESKVPYLWNGSTFISYDDTQSIGYKSDYLKREKLAGAMIWELSEDPNEVLLNKLYSDLK